MNENKFYICKHCGNLVGAINDSGVPMVCCGEKMTLLVPNTVEASHEKHIPVVQIGENAVKVTVGSAIHPMTAEPHIEWIYLQTKCGGQRKRLEIGQNPTADFFLIDDVPVAVFAYCNLHGLWKFSV
ncbi:MAG: desulfoferrodoxin family protein [Clostridia bacterium]